MKKEIKLLIKWLKIPKTKIEFYPFPKKLNKWSGLGGAKISINTNKKMNFNTLHTIIHEYIHMYFWGKGEHLDLWIPHKLFEKKTYK